MLNITSTRVKIGKIGKLQGVASIVIDDCLVIRDIRIIEGNERLFVGMPSKQLQNGEFIDVINPINQETREYIEKVILNEFSKQEELYNAEELSIVGEE